VTVASRPEEPAATSPKLAGAMLAAVGLAILLAVAWWVTNSSVFDLDPGALRIRGNAKLSRAEVARLAGVGESTNLLWFRPVTVERRLERSPWIASARVSRTLPSSMAITILERRPVALIGSSGRRYLVSADGVVLASAPRGARLPFIRASERVRPGVRLGPGSAALVVVRSFPPGLRDQVEEVSIHRGAIDLKLRSGVRVNYGDASEAPEKAAALIAVLAWADRADVEPALVDVRAPGAPALRPAGASAAVSGRSGSGGNGPLSSVPSPGD
jgi:cell division protein FtsQ